MRTESKLDLSSLCRLLVLLCPVLVGAHLLVPPGARAQSVGEAVLHSFRGASFDGASLKSGVLLGRDGTLYGTSWGGGGGAGGTVFKMKTDGSGYTLLHIFAGTPDGKAPYSSLVQGHDGLLYGTTYYGGAFDAGTVFKMRTDGSGYEVVYSFAKSPDGAFPWAGVIQGRDGALYGTTLKGGTSDLGTVFTIQTNGTGYAVLHHFVSNFHDGFTPYAGLLQGHDGSLYGTTDQGGSTLGGTIYRIGSDGTEYEVLHTFVYEAGFWPRAALIQGSDGTLYGTTYSGGPVNAGGTVFRMQTNGLDFAVLHGFPGGSSLWAGLAQASDGALYGAASWGGTRNGGFLFRLHTDGNNYSVLHNFPSNGPDGSRPLGSLVTRGGVLFGTTDSGGIWGLGSVFVVRMAPSLSISGSEQGPRITLSGFSQQPCRLDETTDATNWRARVSLVLTNGTAEFLETEAMSAPSRLYRAVVE